MGLRHTRVPDVRVGEPADASSGRSRPLVGVATQRMPVSIICVFNDLEARRRCLDRSIEQHRDEATVEYLPVDNTGGRFATAGAALNHGASLASHDYIVFVHQDVYLHSLRALAEAAGRLAGDASIGLLGALGIASSGRAVGSVRDRVLLLGEPAALPVDVDSLDELLFVIPKELVLREPLAEDAELAWHAYAIEYGLRVRSLGLRVCAVDMPLTHNSLTTNLARLDVAYDAVARQYSDAMPVQASCGVVGAGRRTQRRAGMLDAHRWRYRWLRESLKVHVAARGGIRSRCVLSDIRFDVDEVLASASDAGLHVVNIDHGPESAHRRDEVELERYGRRITLATRRLPDVHEELAALPASTSVLLTNLTSTDAQLLLRRLPRGGRLLGFRGSIGYWMLLGPAADAVPPRWRAREHVPALMPALGS
jgi:hypothetical protein